jgi:hypothetical protein
MITKILSGHTSPETAFVCADYPYGFKLRCKKRYWLETNNKGTRFCSQTTNPKVTSREVWNKPKHSTYAEISGCMYLDENEHVQWDSLTQYSELDRCKSYLEKYQEGATNIQGVKNWTRKKEIFEEEMGKFTPRPEYGSELFRSVYSAALHRFQQEKLG